MPLGSRSGNASGDFYSGGRNRQMDETTGNHSRGVGGGRPVKKLGVVAKAVAATMSADRLQGVTRTQKDVKNGKISLFLVLPCKPCSFKTDVQVRFDDAYSLFYPSYNFPVIIIIIS